MKVGEAAGLALHAPRLLWGNRFATLSPLSPLPRPSTHLGFSSSSIHSQSDRESTANDMDFKEGAKEVAAAQSDHLLWGQGQDGKQGPWGVGSRCRPNIVVRVSWILGLGHENDPTARKPYTPSQAAVGLLQPEPLFLTSRHLAPFSSKSPTISLARPLWDPAHPAWPCPRGPTWLESTS